MSSNRFRNVLNTWANDAGNKEEMSDITISIKTSDLHKLQALAEIYMQSLESVTSELLQESIKEIEEAMPYVAGARVIRIEDGQEIYEDVGPTPEYMAALKRAQAY